MFGLVVLCLFFLLLCGVIALILGWRDPSRLAAVWQWLKTSFGFRLAAVGALTLILMAPLAMIEGVVDERARYQQEVTRGIAQQWALDQTLLGPILAVPFTYEQTVKEEVRVGKDEYETRDVLKTLKQTYFGLPDQLTIENTINPDERKRGLYRAVVYTADMTLKASFSPPDFKALNRETKEVLWDQARIYMSASEMRGLVHGVSATVDGDALDLASGVTGADFLDAGFHSLVGEKAKDGLKLEMNLPMKGSQSFHFSPIGKETLAKVTSSWPSPSFSGALLPNEREVSSDGFRAEWRLTNLARSYPQAWIGTSVHRQLKSFVAGVRLFEPVKLYTKTERAVKYGILFIGLTFMAVLGMEFGARVRFHPAQYAVIGAGLTLVYLLILSLSEHFGFGWAYAAATALITLMVAGYAHASLRKLSVTLGLVAILAGLYATLYSILSLEDYALLTGSLLLLVALAASMWLTRRLTAE